MDDYRSFAKAYWDWYEQRGRRPNLLGYKVFEDFYSNMIEDSLLPLGLFNLAKETFMVDVGTGGGFPLLPLALSMPRCQFLGVDSIEKKILAVQDFCTQHNHLFKEKNIRFHTGRLEDIFIDQSCTLLFKAVASCREMLDRVHIKDGIDVQCIFYKGNDFIKLEGSDLALLEKKWKIKMEGPLQTPYCLGRYLISFSPLFQRPLVPRGTKALKKESGSFKFRLSNL